MDVADEQCSRCAEETLDVELQRQGVAADLERLVGARRCRCQGLGVRRQVEGLTVPVRREGRYLLRSNLRGEDPATLWRYYMQLAEVEQAFKELKHDLAVRPVFHQLDGRIEAHIFVAFPAYACR